MEDQKLFSATREYSFVLPHPDGDKTVNTRFPTDQEWQQCFSKRFTLVKSIGRKTESKQMGRETSALTLLKQIITADSAECDGAEASHIASLLEACSVEDWNRSGNAYVIQARVIGGILTTHTLKTPTMKQLQEFSDAAVRVQNNRSGDMEIRANLNAAMVYDSLVETYVGYEDSTKVPLVHKYAVVEGVKRAIEQLQAGVDEDFT